MRDQRSSTYLTIDREGPMLCPLARNQSEAAKAAFQTAWYTHLEILQRLTTPLEMQFFFDKSPHRFPPEEHAGSVPSSVGYALERTDPLLEVVGSIPGSVGSGLGPPKQ
ncbi:unnamed protein product [Albugo candida]|uniref:Uncharacterized protein n=1 Tax=Albugo candida TaxID=65357 RepID=A0A024FWL3_9STRA|nr:unnamed protein product [Albugo candida]|eukprot:CCI11480.1 unnamed protein product [Albugo candida]